jgi:DNA polymerase-4
VSVKVKFADFRQITRSRSFPTAIACDDLLRQASVDLIRTLLPVNKGVRLLGVTVSNFAQEAADAADTLPLFGIGNVIPPSDNAAPRVATAGVPDGVAGEHR